MKRLKSKRVLALILAPLLILGVLGVVFLVTNSKSLPTRTRGQLSAALLATKNSTGPDTSRIATDQSHPALVSTDGILWFDQAGHEFQTPSLTATDTLRLFDQDGYTNYSLNTAGNALTSFQNIFTPVLLIAALIFIASLMRRNTKLGKSSPRKISSKTALETFADIAGIEAAIVELSEVVDALRHPADFAALGARLPKGVLLEGPPGTGKTLLAKAVAGEAHVPFFSISGSEFVELYVGIGASRVRDLFAQARKESPSIVYIDEIDAVARRRSGGYGNANDEREQTLNQLLVEMDGLETGQSVVVLASTNRADILDPAILRPGRFDRRVQLDNPDIDARAAILQIHARKRPLDIDANLRIIARQTPGFSGADLGNLINEAAFLAARGKQKTVTHANLEGAVLRVISGPTRASILTSQEREIVAYHEMGHTLVGMSLQYADPVHKVSIVSRGRALGFTMQMADREQPLANRHQLADKLAGWLGGRAAEELIFSPELVTTGASDDIKRASELARRMVTEFGMSPLGLRYFHPTAPGETQTYSEATARAIDAEVDRLLDEGAHRARDILAQRQELLVTLANRLLEVETMEADELIAFVNGADPHTPPTAVIHDRRLHQPILVPSPMEIIPDPPRPLRVRHHRRWWETVAATIRIRIRNS